MEILKKWNSSRMAVFVLAMSLALTAYPGGTGPAPALGEGGGRFKDCRMTGGGSVFDVDWAGAFDGSGRVTHGFELHCTPRNSDNLEINWKDSSGNSHRFHLLNLDFALCSDDPAIDPNPPDATFDTFFGMGTGRFDGVPGATAVWTFTDAGEPGTGDTAAITITDVNGNIVLNVGPSFLTFGNHQAHSP